MQRRCDRTRDERLVRGKGKVDGATETAAVVDRRQVPLKQASRPLASLHQAIPLATDTPRRFLPGYIIRTIGTTVGDVLGLNRWRKHGRRRRRRQAEVGNTRDSNAVDLKKVPVPMPRHTSSGIHVDQQQRPRKHSAGEGAVLRYRSQDYLFLGSSLTPPQCSSAEGTGSNASSQKQFAQKSN